jgi:hypothetical protein
MKYDYIIENIKFSYSSANSFHTCPFGFFLTYIESEDRIGNGFSSYGNYIHDILEKFFAGTLEEDELLSYYVDNYSQVEQSFPPYPAGMPQSYYDSGYKFFESFTFNKDRYQPIVIEDYINSEYEGIKLVVKPDLVLHDTQTNKYQLVDYKTAKLKTGKYQKQQIDDYMKQFLLYSFFLKKEQNIVIDQIKIWFIRDGIEKVFDVKQEEMESALKWFKDTIDAIYTEEQWLPNTDKSNAYFCQHICGVRHVCPHKM